MHPSAKLASRPKSSAAVSSDQKPDDVRTATAAVQGEAAKPVTAVSESATPPAATPPKSPAETALDTDFMVPRSIASVAPKLAAAFTAATVPAMFLAPRQIASTPHALVSSALPALAASPKPVATTAVALPVPAEPPPAAEPVKPRKAVQRRQTNRQYSNDYHRRQQNFFPFFFR